ncbi:MAG: tetratricopeptide repeat protein [Syntrophothermus sp.]
MKIAAIINYSSIDYEFLPHCLNNLKAFASQIIIPVADHFYIKIPENTGLLEQAIAENSGSGIKFIKFRIDEKSSRNPMHWYNFARYIGFMELGDDVDYVIFLNADEIPDAQRFSNWLNSGEYNQFDVIEFSCYSYFRETCYQAEQFPSAGSMVKKSILSRECFLQNQDQHVRNFSEIFVNNVKTMAAGLDNLPLIHDFFWVKEKDDLLLKIALTGEENLKNWKERIEIEYSQPFSGNDLANGFSYKRVKPFLTPGIQEDMTPGKPDTRFKKKDIVYKQPSGTLSIFERVNEAEHLIESGRIKEAREKLEAIMSVDPNNLSVMNNLAIVEILEKNYSAATDLLEKLLSIDPACTAARENLELILHILTNQQ